MERLITAVAIGLLWTVPIRLVLGQSDPIDEQLQSLRAALRDAADVETVLEKVDALEQQASVPPEVREAADYLAGELLVEAAEAERRVKERLALLERAEKRFSRFLEDHPRHALGARAATNVANAMIERARIYMTGVEHGAYGPEDEEKARRWARSVLEIARNGFASLESQTLDRAKELQQRLGPSPSPEDRGIRDRVYRDLIQYRLWVARVAYEIARTYKPDAAEHESSLRKAAEQYGALYEKYSAYAAGMYARMWQGRCLGELGETEKAIAAFEDLVALPDGVEAFAALKSQAIAFYVGLLVSPEVGRYQDAAEKAHGWREAARGKAQETGEWGLAIAYFAGEAHQALARRTGDPEQRRRHMDLAREAFQLVAQHPGEHQKKAEERLRELGAPPRE